MSGHAVVIVESPAKAKTINKYLGTNYTVLASFGHVRDLPPKDGSVLPDSDFAMAWEMGERAGRPMAEIKKAMKGATEIILATDPDREGEAISWHLHEVLKGNKDAKNITFKRVTFNEITKDAIKTAFAQPRIIDQDLVDAYLARRALDYLVGFTLSPVLWRKLPGSRSAGRVQSVALRLICDRESEIEKFVSQEYWSIGARLKTVDGAPFMARLTHVAGNKLGKLDIPTQADAEAIKRRIESKALRIQSVEAKQTRRHPYPPFITSSLQMEASRKLGFSASETMRVAQRLYEGVDIGGETVGLITYMRTDGTTLSGEAVSQLRSTIKDTYGERYVPDSPRLYKSKSKNAQEAHEAIRPTQPKRTPEQVARYVGPAEARLYELIWKRAMASQMESALVDQTTVDFSDGTDDVILRATGSVVTFDGFLTLYDESHDDANGDDDNRRLPPMSKGDPVGILAVQTEQHATQPPPRYSEATLVKKLEEEGIGRPSTYASIIQVLQDRLYVRLEQKRFIPEDRGRIVVTFLTRFFAKYVDYKFTADLEEELDAISAGHVAWREALRQFWTDFSRAIDQTKDLSITAVIDALDDELGPHFFPARADGREPRACPSCNTGRLGLKLARNGAFIGCSNYPDCRYTTALLVNDGTDQGGLETGQKDLGIDVETGEKVSLRRGPYGVYVQLGDGDKPKRQGLPKGLDPATLDLDTAMRLLSLPRLIGLHPETQQKIQAGIGRFGPYLKHGDTFKSLPAGDDVLSVGMNRAVEILATPSAGRGGRNAGANKLREIGPDPDTKEMIEVYSGKYGPYVKRGALNATLPRNADPSAFTMAEAQELLAKKAASGGSKKPARGGRTAKQAPKAKTKAPGKTKTPAISAPRKPAAVKKVAKPKAKKTTKAKSAE